MAKKTIAIIGATENPGITIAKTLAKDDYRLLLFSHDTEKLNALSIEIKNTIPTADLDCLGCVIDASWEADIIISAVPPGAEKKVAAIIREVATQKIVVSIAYPPDRCSEEAVEAGTSAAEELQKLLPHSKVVKAFSSTSAADFVRTVAENPRIDSFIAGNDRDAVAAISEIVNRAGFHAINAGELATSRALELTPLHRK